MSIHYPPCAGARIVTREEMIAILKKRKLPLSDRLAFLKLANEGWLCRSLGDKLHSSKPHRAALQDVMELMSQEVYARLG